MQPRSTWTLLQIVIAAWAATCIVGTPAMIALNPLDAWRWAPHNAIYDQMIISIYIVLGLCLIPAVRDPVKHWSLLQFVVLSSVFHGGLMLVYALLHSDHRSHLLGDVWILLGGALMAIAMYRERQRVSSRQN
jgi:uncharacterized BrkB/YihY/UPF0761 family membrane protein